MKKQILYFTFEFFGGAFSLITVRGIRLEAGQSSPTEDAVIGTEVTDILLVLLELPIKTV